MYKVFADDVVIFDSEVSSYLISDATISKELNKAGTFTFTIYPDNPFYNAIEKMKTIIVVKKDDEIIFRGRVLTEEIGFYKDKTFLCEGELAFLIDNVIPPYVIHDYTAEQMFTYLIDQHNSSCGGVDKQKQFKVGTVDVDTSEGFYSLRSNSNYDTTLENIESRLLDTVGGYLYITYDENEKPILNWYTELTHQCEQTIEFGENLLDYTRENNCEDTGSIIVPLGAKLEKSSSDEPTNEDELEKRLTIASVNDNKVYLEHSEAIERYGRIVKVVTWDDVTDPANLLRKGKEYLSTMINYAMTIELNAIDLSAMSKDIEKFRLGDKVHILSEPHNLDDWYLVEKQTIDLLEPSNDKITVGKSKNTFTDDQYDSNHANGNLINRVEKIESDYVTNETIKDEIDAAVGDIAGEVTDQVMETVQSSINQSADEIRMEVSSTYATNDRVSDELSTVYKQLKDSFEFSFTSIKEVINNTQLGNQAQFEEIRKYIRFEDGKIILGENGNELTLIISNDKISFLAENYEVAYFSNSRLYITDAEIVTTLQIGNFAFIPRENGNLSFRKVI